MRVYELKHVEVAKKNFLVIYFQEVLRRKKKHS
jgi:hypothetical protein